MAGMAKKKKYGTTKLSGFTYSMPAIRAIQAGKEYFTTVVPFSVLAKLIEPERNRDDAIPLDRDRPTAIAEYIAKNPSSYVLPALVISIDGEYVFDARQPTSATVTAGDLIFAINATVRIHDGRYRALGISEAVEANADLGDETISMVIFPAGNGIERRLGDIRANQRKPGRLERIIRDPADPIASLTREVIANVSVFTGSIEMVKTTISNRSKNLFTFSSLYQANEALLAKLQDESQGQQTKHAIEFWLTVQDSMPDWTSDRPRVDLRKQTVHAHGVTLCAIATAGATIIDRYPKTWKRRLAKLKSIDWRRSNTGQWEGKAMLGGRMTKSAASIELTTAEILDHL